MSGNQALNINTDAVSGTFTNYAITVHGSDWYWAVCAVMVTATIAFLGLSVTKPRSQRIFHMMTAAITLTASIAYFSMASNLGFVGIQQEFIYNDNQTIREIFYVRYIDWFVTTPLLLADLALTAGLSAPHILQLIFADEVMIITGLVGALISTSYKWAYFTFGCVALFYIVYVLAFEGRQTSRRIGADVGKVYFMCGTLTTVLWLLYPIAWGLCEGGNYLHPDSEAIFYGVLDIFAKPVFGALLIFGHRNIDPARLGLHLSGYEEGLDHRTGPTKETVAPAGTNGTTTTAPAAETV